MFSLQGLFLDRLHSLDLVTNTTIYQFRGIVYFFIWRCIQGVPIKLTSRGVAASLRVLPFCCDFAPLRIVFWPSVVRARLCLKFFAGGAACRCVYQSAPVRALVVPVCCVREKNSSSRDGASFGTAAYLCRTCVLINKESQNIQNQNRKHYHRNPTTRCHVASLVPRTHEARSSTADRAMTMMIQRVNANSPA